MLDNNSHEDRIRQLEYNKTLKGFTLTNPIISGAQYDVPYSGRNRFDNSTFSVAQRGTSGTVTGSARGFTADRWDIISGTGATNSWVLHAFTPGLWPDRGNYFEWNRTVAGSTVSVIQQVVEDVLTWNGQTITLSVMASAGSGPIDFYPTIYQNFGAGGSGGVQTFGSVVTATTTSTVSRWSWTFQVPSVAGKTIGTDSSLNIAWKRDHNSTNGATGVLNLYFPQVEVGGVATPFEYVPHAIEWAKCRRHFKRFLFVRWPVNGVQPSSINAHFPCDDMRTTPTVTLGGGAVWNDASFSNGGGPGANQWGLVLEGVIWISRTGTLAVSTSVDASSAKVQIGGAASMTNMPSDLATNGTSMWVDLSAEI